ncbi:SMI1/KNR4 family protein [Streptomyces sp. DI166]|uniref:SMI1/KNR4 family protein n=1 Tax=Streptomyces sp. DI166 TaxID=1839783 RepID=UPI0011475D4D|nr:SMI1/KNR4 family protein [Streptomyces sp. DI166]
MNWFDELRRAMPSHPGAGDVVDWAAVEAGWETSFPRDFKEFMAEYGAGAIDDYLTVLLAEPRGGFADGPAYMGMADESRNAEDLWPPGYGKPRLIAWGLDSSADILCWRADGDDPDRWPVVVWSRGGGRWAEYPGGMAEFLCRVFRAEFDRCPLGDSALWGAAAPRFLHNDEERRLWDSGIDPWTGEADPFAGMFGD